MQLFFDGGARPNPGPAAGAFVLMKNGSVIDKKAKFLENATNNVAEYTGLIYGLEFAVQKNIEEISVNGDSELVVKQVNGEYKCKDMNLRELLQKVRELKKKFKVFTIQHVARNENAVADALCTQCINLQDDI